MGFQFQNLDDRTRALMLEEMEYDIAKSALYLSPRLSERGRAAYPDLLRAAIRDGGDDVSLANALRSGHLLEATRQRKKPKGGYTQARVPVTAPETLAEGEFNRFYARGLCRRAIEDHIPELEVYRAKEVENPRPESVAMIGTRFNAEALLRDLRAHPGIEPALHLPPGPNSGLSVRLP